jgi:hypothetical protein
VTSLLVIAAALECVPVDAGANLVQRCVEANNSPRAELREHGLGLRSGLCLELQRDGGAKRGVVPSANEILTDIDLVVEPGLGYEGRPANGLCESIVFGVRHVPGHAEDVAVACREVQIILETRQSEGRNDLILARHLALHRAELA